MIYIEQLIAESEYNLEAFFKRIREQVDYDPSWPLVSLNGYYDADLQTQVMKDFTNGKRTRPSWCQAASAESVCHVTSQGLNAEGPVFAVSATCTGSAYAISVAHALSAQHGTPVMVAGGAKIPVDSYSDFWFKSMRAIDRSTGIPFDANSKGFRPGEGQIFMLISAKPINPIAIIDRLNFFTLPQQDAAVGSVELIKQKLFTGVDVSDIAWWNAHAPGTPMGDAAEYSIFSDVFDDRDVPISSGKGLLGHTVTISYAMELAHGIKHIQRGVVPPNINIATPINNDQRIITTEQPIKGNRFLKFNMGFNGKNVLSTITVM